MPCVKDFVPLPPLDPNWLQNRIICEFPQNFKQAITAVYFTFSSLSTVGFGDSTLGVTLKGLLEQ